MTCPTPEALLAYALDEADGRVGAHVEHCVECRPRLAVLRESAAELVPFAPVHDRRADCLDEAAIADFVDGAMLGADRPAVMAHLSSCERCRCVVAQTASTIADQSLVAEVKPSLMARFRYATYALGAAAAIVLMTLPRTLGDPRLVPALREPAITTTVAPRPLQPIDSVTAAERLVWTSVPRALRYRVRLYGGNGAVLWRVETNDTAIALADSTNLVAGVSYFWRVEAQTDWERWAASPLIEFRIIRP